MQLTRLRLTDFRCFEALEINPGPGVNVITGDNASGKTSLLEALYILGATYAGLLIRSTLLEILGTPCSSLRMLRGYSEEGAC